MLNSSVNLDGSLYSNKLMYKMGTPKPADYGAHNNMMSVMAGYEAIGQTYELVFTAPNELSKIRTATDSGLVRVRDVSLMQIPIEFALITESLDTIMSICMLFYQELIVQNVLTVSLNLFSDGNLVPIDYLMKWDRNSLDVGYANFDNNNALNTVSFSMEIFGAIFSDFYTEEQVINRIDLTTGFTL
jgi:hypothetical protein